MLSLFLRPRLALLMAPAAVALTGPALSAESVSPTVAALAFAAAILAGMSLANLVLNLLRGRIGLRALMLIAALCAPAALTVFPSAPQALSSPAR